ncbi:pet117-like protein [Trichonephila inaurata madagascariensis]|uniref:Pet117-like protein n=1 Tax=Trichonephila inaurata madagascariensis TaxID=2747483 RepID=A0A8X6IK60_9ARAC|nr:pet117-like protein [Trichonephila inaurata madagascariensis]
MRTADLDCKINNALRSNNATHLKEIVVLNFVVDQLYKNMSSRAKFSLLGACGAAALMVWYVHMKQEWEREKMHQGVLKDIERQELKKAQLGLPLGSDTNKPSSTL